MSSPEVTAVLESKAALGEGPHYDPLTNELIWVDIDGMSINFFNLADKTNKKVQLTAKPSIAIPCKSGKALLVLLGRKICLLDRSNGMS